jgi:ABC-type transport system involved in multi-copper enzyme maturation permease subunit
MNTTAIAASGQVTRATRGPHPLARVMTWELRRFGASRLFWAQALGFFSLLLLITWASRAPSRFDFGSRNGGWSVSGFVAGTSSLGLIHNLPIFLTLLVILLPFMTADGVTRDLQRHTHELLMTTALPIWAYVWGRFLVGLMMSLGLALLMFAAILGMGMLLHSTASDYPSPSVSAAVRLWVGMVLPAAVLVTSLGFAIVTLLPRLSTLVKAVTLVAWIVGAQVIPSGLRDQTPPNWYVNWDPTSAVTALGMLPQYSFNDLMQTATSAAQFQKAFMAIENKMPLVGDWFVSHLLLGALSLMVVVVVPLAFKRSRDVLT